MRFCFKAAALAAVLTLSATCALAQDGPTTYYLSPTGSDSNDGTAPNKAWQTIARANRATLRPGDRLLFERGQRFAGNLLVTASGTKEAPISVGSFGSGAATLLGGDGFGIRLLNCQYIRVHDLVLVGSGVKPNGQTTNTEQGLDIYSTARQGAAWQSIHVDKLTVSGFRDGIVLHTPIGKQEVVGYNDVRITHCTVKECLFGGIYCWGSSRTSGKPWYLPIGAGVFTNCYLGDCMVHDIYGDPVGDPVLCLPIQILNATSFVAERCAIHHCGQSANPKGSQGGVGGFVFLECDKCVAQFNECHHIVTTIKYDGCAFDIDGGCSNCILQYNYSHDNEGSGFQTGTFPGSSPVTDNTIRYNISQNDATKNIDNSAGIMVWASQLRGQIYNNTVFTSAGLDGNHAAFLGQGSGLTLSNNIFVVNHDGPIVRSSRGCILQNNAYYRTKGGFSVQYEGRPYSSLSDWQKATGQEQLNGVAVGFHADPQFRAPGRGGDIDDGARLKTLDAYDLLPTSPMIGKALDLESLFKIAPGPCDFHGTPLRPTAKFDLGAVQH